MNTTSLNVDPFTSPAIPAEPAASFAAGASLSSVAILTTGIIEGDEAAFRRFHEAYHDRLFRYLLVLHHGDEATARDTLQETFLRVVRHCRRFEEEAAFWNWLTVLARSAARDAGRRQNRYWQAVRRFFGARPEPDPAGRPGADADQRLARLLADGLVQLEPLDRQLTEGKYFEHRTVAELAAAHRLTAKAVESRLHRSRGLLRAHIEKGLRDEDLP